MYRLLHHTLTVTLLLSVLWAAPPAKCIEGSDEPIRVGATLSSSGKYSEPSAMMRDGYRLWAAQINQRGGLLNRRVELIIYDDESNPQLAHDLYWKLIVQDKVDLLLSPYGTPIMLEVTKATEPQQMVLLASASSGAAIWSRGHRYTFGMYALADRYFIGILDLMARRGYRSVSILYEDSPFNTDVAKGSERWAKRLGLAVQHSAAYPPGDTALAKHLKTAAEKNADGLIISVYPPDGYALLDTLRKGIWRPKVLGMPILPIHPDFYKKAGPIAEGIFAPSQWEPDERIPFPGTEKFIKDFSEAYNKLPSYHAGSAYASGQILERAVEETKAVDHERIRDYVRSLDTVTVIGRFKVDHTGRQIGHNPIVIQWQNGKKEIVYPTKMRTAEPKL